MPGRRSQGQDQGRGLRHLEDRLHATLELARRRTATRKTVRRVRQHANLLQRTEVLEVTTAVIERNLEKGVNRPLYLNAANRQWM